MSPTTSVALATAAVLLATLVWFDARCLTDLSRTRDDELRYLTRGGWMLAILATFPLGGMLYLTCAKGPRRYRQF